MEYKKKLTQEDIEKILSEGVKNMPQNPAAQGYKQEQIRGFFYIPEEKILLKIMEVEDGIAEALKEIVAGGGEGGASTDVQINGVSITKDGVANIPYASGDKAGLFTSNAASGIFIDGNSGFGSIVAATIAAIDAKTQKFQPIVPANLDYAVKVGITTNTETLSPEEKAAALAWLGAVSLQDVDEKIGEATANKVVKRFTGGNIWVPSVSSYNGAATSKYYVDNLPDYIPAEQKAKWESWLGSSGGGTGGGSQLYLHQVPIHFTGYGSDTPEFTLILNVLSSQSTAYGSETSIETLVNDTFNKIVSLSFVSTEIRFQDAIVSSFIVKNDAWTLRYIQSVTQTEYTLSGPVDYEGHKLEIMTYTPTPL